MRLTRIVLPVVVLASIAMAGWYLALLAIPTWVTDTTWRTMLGRGSQINVLRQSRVRYAPGDVVGLDNADTVTRSVIYDLSRGPLLFETDVPHDLAYWSVSVFARNSDTLFVANDQKIGAGRYRLIVRLADQHSSVPANAEVVSTSTRGFLLVRAVLKDRNDKADVDHTLAAVARESVAIIPAETTG